MYHPVRGSRRSHVYHPLRGPQGHPHAVVNASSILFIQFLFTSLPRPKSRDFRNSDQWRNKRWEWNEELDDQTRRMKCAGVCSWGGTVSLAPQLWKIREKMTVAIFFGGYCNLKNTVYGYLFQQLGPRKLPETARLQEKLTWNVLIWCVETIQ